jgi:hypothetical protein
MAKNKVAAAKTWGNLMDDLLAVFLGLGKKGFVRQFPPESRTLQDPSD